MIEWHWLISRSVGWLYRPRIVQVPSQLHCWPPLLDSLRHISCFFVSPSSSSKQQDSDIPEGFFDDPKIDAKVKSFSLIVNKGEFEKVFRFFL